MQANEMHKDYYPWFDWLRITLAIIVMIGHDGLMTGWSHSGNFSVQVFFALSGWLIGGILLETDKKDLPRFYFNRAMRIWIPYFFALMLLILAGVLHDSITPKWLEFIFYKLSFAYNLFGPPQLAEFKQAMPLQGSGNHFWSVNAEEQFYLLAPLLLALAPIRKGKQAITWILLAGIAWYTKIYASIVFGVLAAVIAKQYGEIYLSKGWRTLFVVTIAVCILGFIKQYDYDLVSPFCAISIVMLLAIKGKKTVLGGFVGGISYPLYMNHWIGVFLAHAALKPFGLQESIAAHILSFVLNILIAAVLYWFIDKRILAMRPNLYTEFRGKLITLIAYASVMFGICVGLYLTSP